MASPDTVRAVSSPRENGSIAVLADEPELRAKLADALDRRDRAPLTADSLEDLELDAVGVLVLAGSALAQVMADLKEIAVRWPDTRCVVVVPRMTAAQLRRALKAGAHGVVLEAELAAIAPTVEAVACGQLVTPDGSREELAPSPLSAREKQTLGMVVMGFSNGEIARRLYLAESTVKSHLSSAFSKLGVGSRNEATQLILDPAGGLGPGILAIDDRAEQPGEPLALGRHDGNSRAGRAA